MSKAIEVALRSANFEKPKWKTSTVDLDDTLEVDLWGPALDVSQMVLTVNCFESGS